jgi:hypothetical protein
MIKILGKVTETYLEISLKDKLMLTGISGTINMMEDLCTFGAADLRDFFSSYVIGLGIMFLERTVVAFI